MTDKPNRAVPTDADTASASDRRPRRLIRVGVLLAAIACLALTMCTRTRAAQPVAPADKPVPNAAQQSGIGSNEDPGGSGTPIIHEPAQAPSDAPRPEPGFSTSKSAGSFY